MRRGTARHGTAQHGTARRSTVRRGTARRSTARRIAAVVVAGLALPLGACSSGQAGGVGIVRDGCPPDIRIATDDLPRVEWGFLYSLLDADDIEVGANSVSAPLLVDGEPSGATLTILVGDPEDGVSGNVGLYDDERILLAAVDTDAAILDADRYPTVGVFAPLRRDPRMIYWDSAVYPDVDSISALGHRLTPDGASLVPVVTIPGDPFSSFAVGRPMLAGDQLVVDRERSIPAFVEAGGVSAQLGDALVDPYLLAQPGTGSPRPVGWQLLDDAGYERDAGVLSARPQSLVRHADCLDVLVPVLQHALLGYLDDPAATTALLVELSAEFGDERYDAELAQAALDALDTADLAGSGRDGTIGEIDLGHVRNLFKVAVPAWKRAGVSVPAGATVERIVTNRFIDRSIG